MAVAAAAPVKATARQTARRPTLGSLGGGGGSALGFFSKSGNAIGIYKASNQLPSQIIDLATSKTYVIDTATSSFNVTSVGLHNFTGTFSCKLIDGTSLIPATGSFNLYKP